MSSSTQAFISLLLGAALGAGVAAADAFHFHVLGTAFDIVVLGSVLGALGVHWVGAGNIPPLTLRGPGDVAGRAGPPPSSTSRNE